MPSDSQHVAHTAQRQYPHAVRSCLAQRASHLPALVRLDVFDFDNTLFSSPPPSHAWTESARGVLSGTLNWWQNIRTLQAVVDRHQLLWNETTVQHLRDSLADGTSLTLVLTGRNQHFQSLLLSLLARIDATPDLLITKELPSSNFHPSTLTFKLGVLQYLLDCIPTLNALRIYDDRQRHVEAFYDFAAGLKSAGRIHTGEIFYVNEGERGVGHLSWDAELAIARELVDEWKCKQSNHVGSSQSTQSTSILSQLESPSHMSNKVAPYIEELGHTTALMLTEETLIYLAQQIERPQITVPCICIPEIWTRRHQRILWLDDQVDTVSSTPSIDHPTSQQVILRLSRYLLHEGQIDAELEFNYNDKQRIVSLPLFVNHFLHAKSKSFNVAHSSSNTSDGNPNTLPLTSKTEITVPAELVQLPRYHLHLVNHQSAEPAISHIRVGAYVCKHMPSLRGPQIGQVVKHIWQWMSQQGIRDEVGEGREEKVETYIMSIAQSNIVENLLVSSPASVL